VNLLYRAFYRLGFTPWDLPDPHGPLVELLDALPPGRMLDVGCGTGRDVVFAASRGWRATGVDAVPRALAAAGRRAAEAGADVRLVRADIGHLTPADLGDGYTLVQDIGCLHGLSRDALRRAAGTLDAVTVPGATLLTFAVAPRRGPGPHGVDAADLTAVLPGWRVEESREAPDAQARGPMRDARFFYHRLVKSPA
jgi:SAM-dependent methyltransferase